jgi:hypothetical protein
MASVVASAAFLAGVAFLVAGAWLIWPQAGLIVLGLVLMLGAWNYVKGSWASSSE